MWNNWQSQKTNLFGLNEVERCSCGPVAKSYIMSMKSYNHSNTQLTVRYRAGTSSVPARYRHVNWVVHNHFLELLSGTFSVM